LVRLFLTSSLREKEKALKGEDRSTRIPAEQQLGARRERKKKNPTLWKVRPELFSEFFSDF